MTMTMTMTITMTMTETMTMTRGRGRGRSRSRNWAGAGNFKNGRLRQPWIKLTYLEPCLTWYKSIWDPDWYANSVQIFIRFRRYRYFILVPYLNRKYKFFTPRCPWLWRLNHFSNTNCCGPFLAIVIFLLYFICVFLQNLPVSDLMFKKMLCLRSDI